MAGVMGRAQAMLCNDTGMMHVAAAIGTQTLALFSESSPEQWKPPGDHVRGIREPDHRVRSITVEKVWRELVSQLG